MLLKVFAGTAWHNSEYSADLDSDRDTCAAVLYVPYECHVNAQTS